MKSESKKNAEVTRSQKFLLSALFLVLISFFTLFLIEIVSEQLFLRNYIMSGQSVEQANGKIKIVKYYYGGRVGEVMKLSLPGLKKWILMGKVTKEEAPYFVKGNSIEVEVYQVPPNLFGREYNQQHTLRSLGVKVNNQVVRTSDSRKNEALRNNYFFIAILLFICLIALFGLYFISKAPFKKEGNHHD